MKFATEYLASNEIGRVCVMYNEIEARSWADADRLAARTGVGQQVVAKVQNDDDWPRITISPGAKNTLDAYCESIQQQRDADWLSGQDTCPKWWGRR